MKKIESNGVKRGFDVNRFLKACTFEETDHIPCFEQYVMKNTIKNIFGDVLIKEIIYEG